MSLDSPLVAVIGLGGVGSHCAHALLRSGVRRLRLVDFDRVSLSSLNRHAVATRRDVGLSKVGVCASHFANISPGCTIDARDEMFTADAAAALIGGSDRPDLVVDCIDDLPTKADLLAHCVETAIPVLSALGSGGKGDPTRLCVAQGLRDIENDPLASKLRWMFNKRNVDVSPVSFVYSSQKADRGLLPLTDEQRQKPEDFGNVAHFRLRVLPVLGTQPALAGITLAVAARAKLGSPLASSFRRTPVPRRAMAEKLLTKLLREACGEFSVDLTVGDVLFLLHDIWGMRSALNVDHQLTSASGQKFSLTRWDRNLPANLGNTLVATEAEAAAHSGPHAVSTDVKERVERLLRDSTNRLNVFPCSSAESTEQAEPVPVHSVPDAAEGNTPCADDVRKAEADVILTEQLSRSASFWGDEHGLITKCSVVVVGLGAVGSAAASMLVRAGIKRVILVDGSAVKENACHALTEVNDLGLLKVEACRRVLRAINPACEVCTVARDLSPSNSAELLDGHGTLDLVVDCVRRLSSKADVLGAWKSTPCVTAVPPVGAVDPTRIGVSALDDVHDSVSGVALRAVSGSRSQNVVAVHFQELPAALEVEERTRVLASLSLGMAVAAVSLHILAGVDVPQMQSDRAAKGWKKFQHTLRHTDLDVPAIGCVVEHIWRGRSALSRRCSQGLAASAGMRLVVWDRSRPAGLTNVVLLTEEEAKAHDEATALTGSLPQLLLDALPSEAQQASLPDQVRVHRVLGQLQRVLDTMGRPTSLQTTEQGAYTGHLIRDGVIPVGDTPEAPLLASPSLVNIPVKTPIGSGFSGLVGGTPLIELSSLSEATGRRIVAKAEFLSPGGCQKDRVAKQIIADAESAGKLLQGATIFEGTSGSTGISLTLAAAAKGYKVHVVMPDDQAVEKVESLRRFGADVTLVRPASITSPSHYVNVARRLAEEACGRPGPGAYFADQFENTSNFRAHYSNTGPELWSQCGQDLDAFVMSAGTGGTLAGVGRFLKEVSPGVHVCLADVQGSSLYSKVVHGVLYAPEQQERTVRRHRTDTIAEGIGLDRLTANFSSGLHDHNGGLPGIDGAVKVSDQEALEMAQYLLAHEGLFVGSSAAVNCAAACKASKTMREGATVATVLCDSGLRHVTKFYNPEAWAEYGLTEPRRRERGDISFLL